MQRIRVPVVLLILWLLIFYNIERLSPPLDITDVAYTFVAVLAVVELLIPHMRRQPLLAVIAMPIPVYVVLKIWAHKNLWGAALPLTVMEMACIVVTTLLARWISLDLREFEDAVEHITIGPRQSPASFSVEHSEMYREVRRARSYQRPAAMLAIGLETESIQIALDRLTKEAQQVMMKRYALAGVSKTLCEELQDSSFIAVQDDHFLVLMPEVTPDELPGVTERLRQMVSKRVGVNLRIGAASLPQDAITFESLINQAIRNMNHKPPPWPTDQISQLTFEQRPAHESVRREK
jgi:hypothetical protein